MKNTKKVLSVALAGALAFGTMGSAFAAGNLTEGIENKNVAEAVERLNAFGIINGMEDGKYHEEMMVTRAQFAKILVEALGLGGVVGQSTTSFADVDASHWASGYIAVATGQGLIKGYADGTFKPEKEVSYAEAVTMLVRALGYKDEFLKGTWPSNYIGKAAEEDITDGVRVTNGSADRGAVAVMVDNTLDAETVTQKTFGDDNNFEKSGKTLLEEKLEIDKFEDAKIEATPKTKDSLKENEIEIKVGDKTETYEVVEGIDTTNLVGLEADVYVNDDDEIVYIDVTTDEDEALTGVITAVSSKEITVQFANGDDEDYDVTNTVYGYINNKKISDDNKFEIKNGEEFFGKVVLNDKDDVEFVDVYKFDADEGVIVKEINKDKKYVKGLKGTSDNSKVDFDAEDGYKLFLDGKQITIDDLKVGDLVYSVDVNEYDGDTYVYGFVVRNTVEGKLESVKSDEIKIGGKTYDINAKATYSLDQDDEIETFTDVEELEDAIGKNAVIYLDAKGEVRHISTDAKATSSELYGVVVKDGFLNNGDDAVKLLTKEDKEITYTFDDSDDLVGGLDGIDKGDIVKYELDKDGEIDAEEYKVIADATAITSGADAVEKTIKEFDDEKDYILLSDNTKVYVDEDTVLMSYYDDGEVDPSIVKWDDIKDKNTATDLRAVIVMDEDDVNAEFVVFTDNYDLDADGNSAYVKGDVYYDGDYKVDVELANGTSKTILVKDTKKNAIKEGDFIVFSTNADGEIDEVVRAVYDNYAATTDDIDDIDVEYTMDAGTVVTFKNDVVKLAGGSYKVTDDTAVYVLTLDDGEYDEVEKGDLSDIEEGATVRVIVNDGDVEMVVVVEE